MRMYLSRGYGWGIEFHWSIWSAASERRVTYLGAMLSGRMFKWQSDLGCGTWINIWRKTRTVIGSEA